MISFEKMRRLLAEKSVTSYTFRKAGVSQSAWHKIQNGGHIDTRTINALCQLLDCQPGDILEYVPDDTEESPVDD